MDLNTKGFIKKKVSFALKNDSACHLLYHLYVPFCYGCNQLLQNKKRYY